MRWDTCRHRDWLAGALDPEHVVAVGDRIKLSTDALREATGQAPDSDALRAFWYKISPCTLARSADILAQAAGRRASAQYARRSASGAEVRCRAGCRAAVRQPAEGAEPAPPSFGITPTPSRTVFRSGFRWAPPRSSC